MATPVEEISPAERIDRRERIKYYVDIAQIITGIAAIAALLLSIYQFMLLKSAFDRTDRQNNIAALAIVTQQEAVIDAMFVNDPAMVEYFYSGVDLKKDDPNQNKVLAISIAMLDFFENVEDIINYLPPDRTTAPAVGENPGMFERESWEKYMVDTFHSSPAMCAVWKSRRAQYDEALNGLAGRGCSN